jgi:thiol-disulfide isomerase/thioredoxin
MKNVIAMLCFVIASKMVLSQPLQKVFTINDTFSTSYSNNLFNSADFHKRKPVILTFWSPNCGGTLHFLEELETLKNKFQSRVNLIAVTASKKEEMMARLPKANKNLPSLSYIFSDTILSKYFPHRTTGHTVWISANNIVKHITRSDEITNKNVSDFENGISMLLPLKKDILDFDNSAPLWLEGQGRHINQLLTYSYFMNEIKGLPGGGFGFRRDSAGKLAGIKVTNFSLASYFEMICAKSLSKRMLSQNDFVWKVDTADSLLLKTKFCYESSIVAKSKQELLDKLSNDLRMTFQLEWMPEKENKIQIRRVVKEVDSKY